MENLPNEVLANVFKSPLELLQVIEAYEGTSFQIRLRQIFNDLIKKYTTRGLVLLTLKSGVVFDKPIEDYDVDQWIQDTLLGGREFDYDFIRYYLNTRNFDELKPIISNQETTYFLFDLIRHDENLMLEISNIFDNNLITFLIDYQYALNHDEDFDIEPYLNFKIFDLSVYSKKELFKELIAKINNDENLTEVPIEPPVDEKKEKEKIRNHLQESAIDIVMDRNDVDRETAERMINTEPLDKFYSISEDTFLVFYPDVEKFIIDESDFIDYPSLYFKKNLPKRDNLERYLRANYDFGIFVFEISSGLKESDFN